MVSAHKRLGLWLCPPSSPRVLAAWSECGLWKAFSAAEFAHMEHRGFLKINNTLLIPIFPHILIIFP